MSYISNIKIYILNPDTSILHKGDNIEGMTFDSKTISEDMIDELKEIGTYQFQIRLYDDDMNARVTLPPVLSGIEVKEPLVSE